jgi:hypothetical protein
MRGARDMPLGKKYFVWLCWARRRWHNEKAPFSKRRECIARSRPKQVSCKEVLRLLGGGNAV